MRKTELKVLERVFEAEIYDRLPFQSHAKIYKQLCEDGYLQPMVRELGGRFPVKLTGYQLTHAGRFMYCSTCEGESMNEETL